MKPISSTIDIVVKTLKTIIVVSFLVMISFKLSPVFLLELFDHKVGFPFKRKKLKNIHSYPIFPFFKSNNETDADMLRCPNHFH